MRWMNGWAFLCILTICLTVYSLAEIGWGIK